MKDCIFLVPDSNTEAIFNGFLSRNNFHKSLDVPSFTADVLNPGLGDTAIFTSAHELLRLYQKQYVHAVVVIDLEWGGTHDAREIENHIKNNLIKNGWDENKCEVLVIEPEIESWLWSLKALDHLENIFLFRKKNVHPDLREWLEINNLWPSGIKKPPRPKEAIEAICKATKIPRSSSNYRKIASRMSVRKCEDAAFLKLKNCLIEWFS